MGNSWKATGKQAITLGLGLALMGAGCSKSGDGTPYGTPSASSTSSGTTAPGGSTGGTTVPGGSTGGTTTPGTGTQPPAGSSAYFEEDFETAPFSTQIPAGSSWEVGQPTSGPQGANSGQSVMATVLAGQYTNNTDGRVTLPSVSLQAATAPELVFHHFFDTENVFDGGHVLVSTDGGVNFGIIAPVNGYPASSVVALGSAGYTGTSGTGAGFVEDRFDLTPFVGQDVIVAFRFASDGSITADGWYIDDIRIQESTATQPPTTPTNPTPPTTPPVGTNPPTASGVLYQENLDAASSTLILQPTASVWQIGAPAAARSPAPSAPNVIGTVLGQAYANNSDENFMTPAVSLATAQNPRLKFKHHVDSEQRFDGGQVLISADGGLTFQLITPVGGYTGNVSALGSNGFNGSIGSPYANAEFDLAPFVGQDVIVSFRFASDGSITQDGWFIDDITIEDGPAPTPQQVIFAEDFESAVSFTSVGGVFEFGVPGPAAPTAANNTFTGPTAAPQGTQLAGTDLDDLYDNSVSAEMVSPLIDLSQLQQATLLFKHSHDIEPTFDGGRVLIEAANGQRSPITPTTGYPSSSVVALNNSPGFSGTQTQFTEVQFDLSAFAGQQVRIVFEFASDSSVTRTGWYIDDIRVTGN